MSIIRFNPDMDGEMEPEKHGRWVTYQDHRIAVDALKSENDKLREDRCTCGMNRSNAMPQRGADNG